MTHPYPAEILDPDEDNGTMPNSLAALGEAVIGHKIVSVEPATEEEITALEADDDWGWFGRGGAIITLDNGTRVALQNTDDCCAFTELEAFLLHPDKVDHLITGVGSTDRFTRWHVFADAGDILELTVGWSSGNPFYYGYGFNLVVAPV